MRFVNTTVTRFAAPALAAVLFAAVLAAPAGAAPADNARAVAAQITAGPSAAAASPDGHAAVNTVSVAAATTAPDGHVAVNPNGDVARVHAVLAAAPQVTPSTGATQSDSGDGTPWEAIGFGLFGVVLLLLGSAVLVRHHGGDGRHAAAGV